MQVSAPPVQLEGDARPGACVNAAAQRDSQSFDIRAHDAAEGWLRIDRGQRAGAFRFHGWVISEIDITKRANDSKMCYLLPPDAIAGRWRRRPLGRSRAFL